MPRNYYPSHLGLLQRNCAKRGHTFSARSSRVNKLLVSRICVVCGHLERGRWIWSKKHGWRLVPVKGRFKLHPPGQHPPIGVEARKRMAERKRVREEKLLKQDAAQRAAWDALWL